MAHGRTLPAAAPPQDRGDLRTAGTPGAPPDPLGYSSSSPAASPDSCGLASPAAARGKGARGGGAGVPRQSASEREKLRMRRLAQALLRLRHYLPPALAPAGQTLTKIETLRLATRYIAHLSALLGLGRGAPAPRHCPLCPRGLGCCQDTQPRAASPPRTAGWGSPPTAVIPPQLHGAPGMGTGAWGSPLCSPAAAGTAPEVLGGPEMGLETWGSPPYTPAAGTLPDVPGGLNIGMETWGSPSYIPATGTPPEVLGVSNIQTETWGPAPYVPADLSADLLSLLEALFPAPPRH
uniref:BHLH domain-containing protein n=1 Tax=Taeniopygia guttata TaxID=59729 RepID=A0A674HPC8_TAEGU